MESPGVPDTCRIFPQQMWGAAWGVDRSPQGCPAAMGGTHCWCLILHGNHTPLLLLAMDTPFPSECQAPQPPLSTQISCIALSDPMPYMRGTWGTAFLVFFCHLALACSTGSLCTRDSAAQMSQMFANPSSTLPYPEPGALSSTAPGLIGLILITAALQFWSKGALTLMGAP